MQTTTTARTTQEIIDGYENEHWLGWGYLGGRSGESERKVAKADRFVIRMANENGWSAEDLFEWLNSKPGRWFADFAFSTPGWKITDTGARSYFTGECDPRSFYTDGSAK